MKNTNINNFKDLNINEYSSNLYKIFFFILKKCKIKKNKNRGEDM